MTAFRGWPPEALEFLRELEANNDRDWFKANRARYDEQVVAPTQALAEDLSDLGRAHTFRPWNDTRFRPGPPIKEHVGLAILAFAFWAVTAQPWRGAQRAVSQRAVS